VNYHFNEGAGGSTADSAALNGNTTGNLSNGVAWVSSTMPAGGLSVTMADSLLIDTNGNGKANANDTLRYTVVIRNDGTNTLTNLVLNVPANPNTTLVPGSVKAPPKANNDGPATNSAPGQPFHGALNVALNISAPGLLANDTLGAPAATIASFGGGSFPGTATTTAAGSSANAPGIGTLTVNANGSVTFTPTATFNGLATFQYRLTNSAGGSTATATLAIGVRPSAAGETYLVTGNVRVNTANIPQSVLVNDAGDGIAVAANTAPANGAVAFAAGGHFTYTPNRGFTGADTFNYTITNGFGSVNATVALNVSNRVWSVDVAAAAGGDGRAHTPYNSLAAFNAVNNNVAPNPRTNDVIVVRDGSYAGGLALTNDQRVVGDGWSGTFAAAAGFALAPGSDFAALSGTDPVFSPASGNGVNLALNNHLRGLTVSNCVAGFGFAGGAVGNLVVAECSKRGPGGAVSVTNGAFGTSVNFDLLESTSSPGANLFLGGVTGTLGAGLSGAGFTGSAAGSSAVGINGGSVALTYSGVVTKTSGGSLVNVSNHTGALTFSGAMSASAGDGFQFDNADGTYNVVGAVTLNGGDAGIDILNGSAGNFSFANAPITGPTGIAFRVNGGNGTIAHSGAISKNNAGVAVDIQGRTGGSVTLNGNITASAGAGGILVQNCSGGTNAFNGATKSLSTGVNPGVNLVNNTGATINFTGGGLGITTTSGIGFNATGGGTVSLTTGANNNTVTTTTGIGVNIVNTTIGGSGVTFRSIAVNGASSGIVLNNTGTALGNGGLTVTGNGSTLDSGGVIQNTANDGIQLISTRDVSLNGIRLQDNGSDGIAGSSVTNFTLTNARINGAGNDNEEDGIVFGNDDPNVNIFDPDNNNPAPGVGQITTVGISGTVLIQDTIIDAPTQWGIRVYNNSASHTLRLTLRRVTVQNNINTFGEAGFSTRIASGTAFMLVDDCDFLNTDGPGVDGQTIDTGILHLTVQNSVFTENRALPMAVNFVTDNTSQGFVKIHNNIVNDCANPADCSIGFDLDANRTSSLHAIVTSNSVPSGTGIGSGLEFVVGDGAMGRAEVRDNTIVLSSFEIGMTFHSRSEGFGGSNGRLDVTLEGNSISNIQSGGLFVPGVQFLAGSSTGTHDQDMAVNIATSQNAGGNIVTGVNSPGLTPRFEVSMRTGTTFILQGFTGTGTSTVSVGSHFDLNNNATTLDPTFVRPSGGTAVVNYTAGIVLLPTTPTLP
jgi:hypothetical protein